MKIGTKFIYSVAAAFCLEVRPLIYGNENKLK